MGGAFITRERLGRLNIAAGRARTRQHLEPTRSSIALRPRGALAGDDVPDLTDLHALWSDPHSGVARVKLAREQMASDTAPGTHPRAKTRTEVRGLTSLRPTLCRTNVNLSRNHTTETVTVTETANGEPLITDKRMLRRGQNSSAP